MQVELIVGAFAVIFLGLFLYRVIINAWDIARCRWHMARFRRLAHETEIAALLGGATVEEAARAAQHYQAGIDYLGDVLDEKGKQEDKLTAADLIRERREAEGR